MSTSRFCVVISILSLMFAAPGRAASPATTQPTRPTTGPATTIPAEQTKAPRENSEAFMKGLEAFLAEEHRNPTQAKATLATISEMISKETVGMMAAMAGTRASDLTPEQMRSVRRDLASMWAALINFYAGHIDYAKMRVIPLLGPKPESEAKAVHVIFPAVNPKFPRPVNIMVVNVPEDGEWKITKVIILPKKGSTTMPAIPVE